MSFAGVSHILIGGGDSLLLGGGNGVLLIGGNIDDHGSIPPRKKVSYKRPPTFTEALINEQRAASLAMNLAESAISMDEPDEDEIDEEILLKALTLRILN